jgi:GIY-YIG catalytic domain
LGIDLAFRQQAVRTLINAIGCYVLRDLDGVPIYVGQSTDGIRSRVNRHLTSARSDIIANRQVDVWEIAWVWAYPVADRNHIDSLEDALFHDFHAKSPLMNGKTPRKPVDGYEIPKPSQIVQVMADKEIADKRDPALRLPRQAEHYSQVVGHFLAVKRSKEIAGAIQAHFDRLQRYHEKLLATGKDFQSDEELDATLTAAKTSKQNAQKRPSRLRDA